MGVLIKADESTDMKYGCRPEERPIKEYIQNGVINLDKPPGPTSHQVVAWVKRMLSLNKAGHAGTLDPRVSGVLPVALENAVKALYAISKAEKEYIGVLKLHDDVDEEKIRKTMSYFIGDIYQRPPLRSAVKRTLRIKKIYNLEVLEVDNRNVLFHIKCESGTYIRMLCHHIGILLGVGGHMQELRRISSGPFKEDSSLTTLHKLKDAYDMWLESKDETFLRKVIQPMERLVADTPKIFVRDSAVDAICNGANLYAQGVVRLDSTIKRGSLVALMTLKNELIALGTALRTSSEIFEMDYGVVVKTIRVIMKRKVYPKVW
ncbi:MAG: RNA-guided pseudouridylation complex pseudouridine synthase subunit Cbf5 [Candidatus Methanomethylicia archaeon]